jgi:hypothetical protein
MPETKCNFQGTDYCQHLCPTRYDCLIKKESQNEAKPKDGVPSY